MYVRLLLLLLLDTAAADRATPLVVRPLDTSEVRFRRRRRTAAGHDEVLRRQLRKVRRLGVGQRVRRPVVENDDADVVSTTVVSRTVVADIATMMLLPAMTTTTTTTTYDDDDDDDDGDENERDPGADADDDDQLAHSERRADRRRRGDECASAGRRRRRTVVVYELVTMFSFESRRTVAQKRGRKSANVAVAAAAVEVWIWSTCGAVGTRRGAAVVSGVLALCASVAGSTGAPEDADVVVRGAGAAVEARLRRAAVAVDRARCADVSRSADAQKTADAIVDTSATWRPKKRHLRSYRLNH